MTFTQVSSQPPAKDNLSPIMTAARMSSCRKLQLNNIAPVASGHERDIYILSAFPGILVKVANHKKKQKINWRKRLKQRFISTSPHLRQMRELKFYFELKLKEHSMKRPAPVADMFGFVDTDLGPGLICEAIHQKDGQLAPTLKRLLQEHQDASTVIDLLNDFVSEAYEWNMVANDINLVNLVLSTREQKRLVLVDGLGFRGNLGTRTLFRHLNFRSLDRRFAKLDIHPDYAWNTKKRQYQPKAPQ
ncbi:hypothetical protein J7382_08130 [Shimia sp. R11_0]|uniref:YrbL family protein n=1 Tax=Shimia sp. R11_0 TaxID=2821096 RepID=UPI001ADAFCEA|nr:YrbL family protein [Shimia sp. R11_0]MBO9477498.1 hypothetical protein [Shimia sp. R11_0]